MIRRIVAATGIAAAAGVVAVIVFGTAFLMGSLPSRRGTVAVPRLRAPVDACFDKQGVPHLRAVLEVDAWRALGFIHAADRMFQMELRRRAAAGRLAEIFGEPAVARDREARLSGYASLAGRDWIVASESERSALSAYADGVNAYLADYPLPLEMRALSLKPEPWTPVDSLAFGRLMQDDLSASAAFERDAFDDARARGPDAAIALLDASEPGSTEVDPQIRLLLATLPRTAGLLRSPSEAVPAGSNAWALSGRRTASGKPLLAGDPHLLAERPGVWYAAHLKSADGLDAAGLTLPGVPGIVIGHDGRVAWSLTMHQADDADLFVEQVDWAAGTWRHGDRWLPLDRTRETIHVKGGADVVVDVARTVHGPIVERLDDARGFALARAFAPADLPQGPRAFLASARARDAAELLAAWSQFAGPSVNVCWADASGAIGIKVAGAIPRRRAGRGRFPVPGWTGTYDWDGTVPAEALPAIADPPDGVVASANDDWSVSGRRLPYPGSYAEADRAGRARQLGSALSRATVADMRAMQHDVYSPYAARIVRALGDLTFADPRAARAALVLSSWDARAETRGPARLFFAFMKEIRKEVTAPFESRSSGARVTWAMLDQMISGRRAQSFWDDPATSEVETRSGQIERALAAAVDTVEREDGPDSKHWSWGKVHRLLYEHPFARALPASLARRLVFGPVALPGEWHTLDVAGFSSRGEGYRVTEIPSARIIVDLSEPDASRLVLPLGQSGQILDGHATDQLRAWATGGDFPLPFTSKAVQKATVSTLRFVPAD